MRHFWVDRIVEVEPGRRAVGVKCVALSEDVFDHHFPGNPVLPGIYLIEGLAQTAGFLLTRSTGANRIAIMASIDRVRFHDFVRPGSVVRLEVEVLHLSEDVARIRGTALRDGDQVAAAQISFRMLPVDAVIPDNYRAFWRDSFSVVTGDFAGNDDG